MRRLCSSVSLAVVPWPAPDRLGPGRSTVIWAYGVDSHRGGSCDGRSRCDQGPTARPADAAGAADRDLVAAGAVDARAEPRPLRRHLHDQDRQRRHLGDALGPGAGQAGLHRRPACLPRRRGQRDPAPDPRRQLGPRPRREAAHRPAPAAAAALPRRAHAGLRRDDGRDRRPRDRELAYRHPLQAAAADAGDHAGDHPRDRLRRPRQGAHGPAAGGAARLPRPHHRPAPAAAGDPDRPRPDPPHPRLPPPRRPGRRADLRRDRRAPRSPRTWPSATTSSRSWSPPATRTAAR